MGGMDSGLQVEQPTLGRPLGETLGLLEYLQTFIFQCLIARPEGIRMIQQYYMYVECILYIIRHFCDLKRFQFELLYGPYA